MSSCSDGHASQTNRTLDLAEAIAKDLPVDKYPETIICHSLDSQKAREMAYVMRELKFAHGVRIDRCPFSIY